MEQEVQAATKTFVRVPPLKVFIMYFLTFGWYVLWWATRNWKVYAARNNKEIWPVVRAIFFFFICYPLFKDIYGSKKAGVWMTVLIWGMLIALALLVPHMFYLDVIVYAAFYTSVQCKINTLSDESHNIKKYSSYTGLTFLAMLLGVLFWGSVVLGHRHHYDFSKSTGSHTDSTPATMAN